MSTKDIHQFNFWWSHLDALNRDRQRAVSAGELAKKMGTARSTAMKYLKAIHAEGQARIVKQPCKNHQYGSFFITNEAYKEYEILYNDGEA